jgi:uncharacterized protein (DUF305 family)
MRSHRSYRSHPHPYTSAVRRVALVTGAALTAVLLLAGCGGGDTEDSAGQESPSTEQHNAADVTFAQQMLPHHRQAVEMADLALDRSTGELETLAVQIKEAQDPEIETLSGWLTEWDEEVPEDGTGHSGHSDHDMGDGMMSEEQMAELENATGEDFDIAFLEMMIEHHLGAVKMSETERSEGAYGPAIAMAEAIITSQTAEIERMNELLADT